MKFNSVFVLDTNKRQLDPVHPAVARMLLRDRKAAVFRKKPFTIIIKSESFVKPEPVILKIDPGSVTTGLALVKNDEVIWAGELTHRSQDIVSSLQKRKAVRNHRRSRKTRYRKPKFKKNQKQTSKREIGWLPPSQLSRINNIRTWVNRLRAKCNITSISFESVRFDTQLMEKPEISGKEYQQGTLFGYEVREYLLEKFKRTCAYCDKTDVPLQIDHIVAKSKSGSDRVSNLCIACESCNKKKNNKSIQEFLAKKPDKLIKILSQLKCSLKDAAAMNASRNAILRMLEETCLPIEVGTGGQTKFNRCNQDYPKEHWIDAACVGDSGNNVKLDICLRPLLIKATGRQSRQMCCVNKYGFPRSDAKTNRFAFGYQTGDLVRAVNTKGKNVGIHIGRVAIRQTGTFSIGKIVVNYKNCCLLQKADGYNCLVASEITE